MRFGGSSWFLSTCRLTTQCRTPRASTQRKMWTDCMPPSSVNSHSLTSTSKWSAPGRSGCTAEDIAVAVDEHHRVAAQREAYALY